MSPFAELSGCNARCGRSRAGERAVRCPDDQPATEESPSSLEVVKNMYAQAPLEWSVRDNNVPAQGSDVLNNATEITGLKA